MPNFKNLAYLKSNCIPFFIMELLLDYLAIKQSGNQTILTIQQSKNYDI